MDRENKKNEAEKDEPAQEKKPKTWYVYMLRCEDNSIYTGITTNVERRYSEHKKGVGAKYTRQRKPVKIEKIFFAENRREASRLEWAIKKLSKRDKELMISCEKNQKNFIKEIETRLNIKINL